MPRADQCNTVHKPKKGAGLRFDLVFCLLPRKLRDEIDWTRRKNQYYGGISFVKTSTVGIRTSSAFRTEVGTRVRAHEAHLYHQLLGSHSGCRIGEFALLL